MSDANRKNFSDKIAEGATPQSQKSYGQQAKEAVTDSADKLQRKVEPEQSKSTTQQLGDSISSGHEQGKAAAHDSGKGIEETASEYLDSAKKALNDAAGYVSGALGGAQEGAEGTKKN